MGFSPVSPPSAFSLVLERDLLRLPHAIVRVCLAVASAHRPEDERANLRNPDAGAERVGDAALSRLRLAPQTAIAANSCNSAAPLAELGSVSADGRPDQHGGAQSDDSKRLTEHRTLLRLISRSPSPASALH